MFLLFLVLVIQTCSHDQGFCFGDSETLLWSIFVISGDTDALMITIHCPRRLTKWRAKQHD